MRRLLLLLPLLFIAASARAGEHWVAYYGSALPAKKFQSYDVILFDADSHPPLAPLKSEGKILLGYLSLGEAENYRSYYKTLAKKKLLLAPNKQWKGHRIIDIRNPAWEEYVINTLIPNILAQGFDGVMLDTVDSLTQLENDFPKRYPGMKDAAVKAIKDIRAHFPAMKIMINRGFDILPQVGSDVDMIMAESIYTNYPAGAKAPVLVPAETYALYAGALHEAQKLSPTLKIYTLDYWPPLDKKGVRRIYAAQRAQGFIPYVATINLQTVVGEPK